MLKFQPVSLGDKDLFNKFLRQRRYEGSESTFINLYMWQECYNVQWTLIDNFLCVKGRLKDMNFVLPPYGATDEGIEVAVDQLIEYFQDNNLPFMMRAVSQKMKDSLEVVCPGKFTFTEEPDVFDYVYLAEDLISLAGRKYHRKRNHIKRFEKEYPGYRYVPLTEDLIEPCIINLKDWCIKKGCEEDESLVCERDAVIKAFEAFRKLDYIGGVILINNNVEAFTFGEALNKDTVLIHAEKANSDINGIYQVINKEFLRNNWSQMKYVNREEDMGIEGLRKSKLSYYPLKMIVKYKAELK